MKESSLSRKAQIALTALALLMGIYHLIMAKYRILAPIENQNIHLLFAFLIIFLKAFGEIMEKKASAWKKGYFILLALLAVIATGYIHLNYLDLVDRAGAAVPADIVIGIVLILLSLEASRLTFGPAIPVLTIIALFYMFIGPYLPGIFYHGGFNFKRVVSSLTTSFSGVYGSLLDVSATFVVMFMIFGGLLNVTGGGKFFMNLAMSIGGKFRSGPALAAVISSALMGSINGSAVANVATTGVFTIPLMKKRGYKPYFAGAVEAAASTGGMFLPPVMGVGAFVMSEITGIPYIKIAAAAAIPGILFYLLVGFTVSIRSSKIGLEPVADESIPKLGLTLKEGGYFLIPIIAVVYYLVKGYSPMSAAFYGIEWLIGIYLLKLIVTAPKKLLAWEGWKPIVEGIEEGIKSAVGVAAILACVGIMVQAIIVTGLAHRAVFKMLAFADTPFIALLMAMAIALFFGMGVPTTASYILLAVLAVPALVKMGLPLLAVHLFIYYFTIIANITPPVGSAAIVAARLAGADYNKLCLAAMRMALSAFVLPFVFVYKPELLGQGDFLVVIEVILTAAIGLTAVAGFFENYLICSATLLERVLMGVAALLLVPPFSFQIWIFGLAAYAYVIISQHFKNKKWKQDSNLLAGRG